MCLCVCDQEGLVKANMEKLTFFALSAPEKLDRIAAYLSERLTRELNRHRYGSVHTSTLKRTDGLKIIMLNGSLNE